MKISSIQVNDFKRFSDLSIEGISEKVTWVVLVGPNGSGKSLIFDAFKCWQLYRAYGTGVGDTFYHSKGKQPKNPPNNNVDVKFHDFEVAAMSPAEKHRSFYFRTAYRNEVDFTTNRLEQVRDVFNVEKKRMIDNDATVNKNYERLISKTLQNVYSKEKENLQVSELREEWIGKIRNSMNCLFSDLYLTGIGNPLTNGSFYFKKGDVTDFHYKTCQVEKKWHLIFF